MRKIFSHISRNIILWVILFSIIAYSVPSIFTFIKGFLEYFFAITMFCVGTLVSPEHARLLVKKPLRVGAGTILQFTVMPSVSFLTSFLFRDPGIRIGIILTGCVPGAMASNLMSALANADVALSVSITTLSTLLSPVVTPALLYLLAGSIVKIKFLSMFVKLMWMVVIPVGTGYALRIMYEDKVMKYIEYLSGTAGMAVVLIVAIVVAENSSRLSLSYIPVVLALLIPNIVGYIAGFYIPALFNWELPQRRTVSIEVGMQNAGLGTVLALGYFGEVSAIPPAIYTVLCLLTSAVLVWVWGRDKSISSG